MKFPKLRLLALSVSILLLCIGCSDDDGPIRANPNLPNISVNLTLDLDLPQYNPLNFPGNSLTTSLQGIRGIVIYNIDNNQYTAFELACPNTPLDDCSRMTVEAITATCPCNGNEYNIVTGQITAGEGQYPMLAYRVTRSGNVIQITN